MEARRDEFRNYLETSGAITALTNVLIKLFELPEKPENSVKFICQNMGGYSELEEENEELKRNLADALQRLEGFTGRSSNASNKHRFTTSGPETDFEKMLHGFEQLQMDAEYNSPLKMTLTLATIEELADIRTESFGSSLLDCIQSGLRDHDSPMCIIAADPDCFDVFSVVFDPIIRHYYDEFSILQPIMHHEFQHPATDWGDFNSLTDPDPEKVFILKSQVNCYRSLKDYPFFLKMEEKHFIEVMETIRTYAQDCGQEGSFYELETIDDATKETLSASITLGQEDFIFSECKECWVSSQFSAHWPKGRAVYVTNANELAIRVNHKTHIQFGCVQADGNLITMYDRMSDYAKSLDGKIPCAYHEKYGWLTPFPQYLGAAMEISALVKLHNLPKDECKFKDYLHSWKLKVAKIAPEEDYYYCDVRNARCLGLTEFQLMEEFCFGLANLFMAEQAVEQ